MQERLDSVPNFIEFYKIAIDRSNKLSQIIDSMINFIT